MEISRRSFLAGVALSSTLSGTLTPRSRRQAERIDRAALVARHSPQVRKLDPLSPLSGNGGLLYAIAMMAGGWRGSPGVPAPGFPSDGLWHVLSEGLNTAVLKEI